MSIPTIQGIAGIVAAPDMKFTTGGKAILSVRLAFSDRKYNDQTREWETSKSFYVDGQAWEQTAERLAEQLQQGDQVYVEGRIETHSWEDKNGGGKRSKPVLQLRTVRKLERGGQQQPQQSQGAQNVAAGLGGQQQDPWGAPSGGNDGWGASHGNAAPTDPPF